MYYDLLARIKNASAVKKRSLTTPFSRVDFDIANILVDSGYLVSVEKRAVNKRQFIDIVLKYRNTKPSFTDFHLVSTPKRHFYIGHADIRSVRQGYGMGVISTSEGIMTTIKAKKKKIGGEYLFQIW